jgi:hypothetical protein
VNTHTHTHTHTGKSAVGIDVFYFTNLCVKAYDKCCVSFLNFHMLIMIAQYCVLDMSHHTLDDSYSRVLLGTCFLTSARDSVELVGKSFC